MRAPPSHFCHMLQDGMRGLAPVDVLPVIHPQRRCLGLDGKFRRADRMCPTRAGQLSFQASKKLIR